MYFCAPPSGARRILAGSTAAATGEGKMKRKQDASSDNSVTKKGRSQPGGFTTSLQCIKVSRARMFFSRSLRWTLFRHLRLSRLYLISNALCILQKHPAALIFEPCLRCNASEPPCIRAITTLGVVSSSVGHETCDQHACRLRQMRGSWKHNLYDRSKPFEKEVEGEPIPRSPLLFLSLRVSLSHLPSLTPSLEVF